jgi:hypothetical protein
LVSSLKSFIHFDVHVKLHIIHYHLDYIVGFLKFLDFLFGFVAKYINFALTAFLSLFKFIVQSTFPLSEKLFPFLFCYLLTISDLFIPFLFAIFYLSAHLLSLFLPIKIFTWSI